MPQLLPSILTNLIPVFLCWSMTTPVLATIILPRVLSSHMVLQREMPVPIWGTADSGERVTVTFREQTKTTKADSEGKWMIKLDPLQLGAPATLTVTGSNTLTLTDVLVGEVWVGSGQSNIDTPVNEYVGADPLLKEARDQKHPELRLYHSKKGNGWRETNSPDVAGGYSAQLFYFGVLLQRELKVPVGLMEGAVAGSPSAPFLPQEGFNNDPEIQARVAKWDAQNPLEARQKKFENDLEAWKTVVLAEMAKAPGATDSIDNVPKAILSKHPKPKPPTRAADSKTGGSFDQHIRPMIPYAIRGVLWDQGEGGAGFDRASIWQTQVMAALIPAWRKLWGQGDFAWLYVQKPSGGGCALNPADPMNKGAKPFEPLPKTVPPAQEYHSSLHREAYDVMQNPNTFLVITTDLAMGVHPTNKSGYAMRDLRVALGAVYGLPTEYYGPKFDSFKVEGDKLRISFTHLGKGLTVPPDQPLQGFCIAGEDKKFVWADAVIDGPTVLLSSKDVPKPVAARYAWTWPLAWANLFNKDGLPAIGFRTDQW